MEYDMKKLLTEDEMITIIDDEISAWAEDKNIDSLYVITDVGESFDTKDEYTGEVLSLPRYGVWTTGDKGEVIEISNDLESLKEKYNVTEVITINK